MTSDGDTFDVVAVVIRAHAMDVPCASDAELAWADRAADRIRGWVDAWQAQVQFEQTLPRPLPPPPGGLGPSPTDPDVAAGEPIDLDQSGTPAGGTDQEDGAAGASGGSVGADGRGDGSDDGDEEGDGAEPLPPLGPDSPAPESAAEQARRARRMWLLSCLRNFADALRAGRITTGHVDLLAAAADRLPNAVGERLLARGDELLAAATGMTPERFSRVVQRLIAKAFEDEGIDRAAALRRRSALRRGVDDATKMHWLRLDIDPERGAVLFGQLDAEREAIFRAGGQSGASREQLELQALLNLVGRPQPATPSDSGADDTGDTVPVRTRKSSTKKIRGLVLIDATTWLHGMHDNTVCESGSGVPLPPDTVRRLLCIAEITYGILVNGRLVASVVGNDLATPDQRDQLRMMYRTCCGPDCTRPFDGCQIHHVIARSRHGPTDTALMIPLCNHHHDAIHHREWQVHIDPQRNLTWTGPDGRQLECPYVPLDQLDQLDRLDQPTLFDGPSAA